MVSSPGRMWNFFTVSKDASCAFTSATSPSRSARTAGSRASASGVLAALAADPAVRTLVEREVAAVNAQLASFETVKKFHILPMELTVEGGELTPSLKVKRKVVAQRFEREIAALYA